MSSGLLVLLLLSGLGIGESIFHNAQSGECPSTWSLYESRCYQFTNYDKTWHMAEEYCIDNEAHLASFHNRGEYNFIRRLIVSTTGTNTKTWVGGTKDEKDGVWTWSDGSDFSYTHWGPGEPNNAGGHENCMDINLNGQDYVNDENCIQTIAFVCAKDV